MKLSVKKVVDQGFLESVEVLLQKLEGILTPGRYVAFSVGSGDGHEEVF